MNILYMAHQNRHINVSPFKLTIKLTAAREKKVKYSNCFINRELSLEIGKEQTRQDYMITFPRGCGWISELSQAAQCPGHCCRTARVGGTGSTSPEAPDTPRHFPLISQEIFSPHGPFLASKRMCWETQVKEFLWVCWGRGWVCWALRSRDCMH